MVIYNHKIEIKAVKSLQGLINSSQVLIIIYII